MNETLMRIIEDRDTLLAGLSQREALVRDAVRMVAERLTTGFYLFGRAGTGKSHIVRSTLRGMGEMFADLNGPRISAGGLFRLLDCDDLIILDDANTLLRNRQALPILLSAMEPPANRVRLLTHARRNDEERAYFGGGIILISNIALNENDDEHCALKSRVPVLRYEPNNLELGARMIDLADQGWASPGAQNVEILPTEARKVAEFLIEQMLAHDENYPFDMRLLVDKALPFFLLWKDGAESSWEDLVVACIEERTIKPQHEANRQAPLSREERRRAEQEIMQTIMSQYPTRDEQMKAWTQKTGKSERSGARRRAEILAAQH
jgi:hypothetical protein